MLAKTLLLLLALSALPLYAETASRAIAVQTEPNTNAPVLQLIKAGESLPERAKMVVAPAGWSAVVLSGPHEVYVENRFIDKELDVKPGSPLHLSPKTDAPVLTTSAAGDEIEITGLRGRWTQLQVNKPVVAYIQLAAPVLNTAPQVTPSIVHDNPAPSSSGTAGSPSTGPVAGRAVTRTNDERTSLAALPRLFEGRLVSTRSPLRPRRPYDFALEAEDGTRFAYVDLGKLLLTEQIEKYLDRTIVVYGVARAVPDTKDIVISVESLQQR